MHLEAATKEQIEHGKTLVNERGCASCHQINGIKRPDNFAPELTAVGSRPLSKIVFAPGVPNDLPSYLEAKIREPHSFGTAMKMPKFTLATSQVGALVTALLAQTDRAATVPADLRVAGHPESDYQPAGSAGKLMDDLRCFSCHSINGRGGDMAPDLTFEGSSVQRAWLLDFLKNPNTLRPALIRRMPRFNLTDAEAATLTDYIMTVYQTPAFDSSSLPASSFTAADREHGRQLFYSKYACQSCHIVDPNNDKGYIGPTLTRGGPAADRGLDLPLLEGSSGAAAGNAGTQPAHQRRGCPGPDRVPDGANQSAASTGRQEMIRRGLALCGFWRWR